MFYNKNIYIISSAYPYDTLHIHNVIYMQIICNTVLKVVIKKSFRFSKVLFKRYIWHVLNLIKKLYMKSDESNLIKSDRFRIKHNFSRTFDFLLKVGPDA